LADALGQPLDRKPDQADSDRSEQLLQVALQSLKLKKHDPNLKKIIIIA